MTPKISLIICTYNRSNELKDLLDCVLSQKMADGCTYEIIIIDNNSKDKTKEVVEFYKPKFQDKLRYFFEPKQGKPFALNLGIKEAQGEIIAFTDDDCLIEENYLANIYDAFQKNSVKIGVLGGKIIPRWVNGKEPKWIFNDKPGWRFKNFFKAPLGILDYGDTPFVIDLSRDTYQGKHFYGANMAIRRNILDHYGYFDINKKVGEDSEICLRLFSNGVQGFYMPQIVVYHKMNARKITPDYYYHWYYLRGMYWDLIEKFHKKPFYPFGIPFWFIKRTINLYKESFFKNEQDDAVYSRCMAFFNLGQMRKFINDNKGIQCPKSV